MRRTIRAVHSSSPYGAAVPCAALAIASSNSGDTPAMLSMRKSKRGSLMTGPGCQNARMIVLETDRLRLRHLTNDDIDRLVELDSDPEVMRYLTWGEPSPREWYADDVMPRLLTGYASEPRLGTFAA